MEEATLKDPKRGDLQQNSVFTTLVAKIYGQGANNTELMRDLQGNRLL